MATNVANWSLATVYLLVSETQVRQLLSELAIVRYPKATQMLMVLASARSLSPAFFGYPAYLPEVA
jgi:hypothetical protein